MKVFICLLVLAVFLVPVLSQPQNLNGIAIVDGAGFENKFMWEVSPSAVSYNLHRGPSICTDPSPSPTTCTSFTQINQTPITVNEFTFSFTFDGVSYLYAVTEVDAMAVESDFSNQLEVRVKQTKVISSTTETTTIITTGPTDWLDELLAQGF